MVLRVFRVRPVRLVLMVLVPLARLGLLARQELRVIPGLLGLRVLLV